MKEQQKRHPHTADNNSCNLMLHVLCGWIISFVSTPSMLNRTTVNSTVIQGHCSTTQCAQKYLPHTHKVVKIKTCCRCSFLLIRDLGTVITCCGNDAISQADLPQQSNHHQSVTHTHTKNISGALPVVPRVL